MRWTLFLGPRRSVDFHSCNHSAITTANKQDGESHSPKPDRAEHSARTLVKTQMPAVMQHIQIP